MDVMTETPFRNRSGVLCFFHGLELKFPYLRGKKISGRAYVA